MRLVDLALAAFSNLWRRKLRTSLTVLAVVIGAMLIALMVSLGSGLESFLVNQFGLMVPEEAIYVSSGDDFFTRQDGSPVEITSTEAYIVEPFTREDVAQIGAVDGVAQVDYSIDIATLYISPQDSDKIYKAAGGRQLLYRGCYRGLPYCL